MQHEISGQNDATCRDPNPDNVLEFYLNLSDEVALKCDMKRALLKLITVIAYLKFNFPFFISWVFRCHS